MENTKQTRPSVNRMASGKRLLIVSNAVITLAAILIVSVLAVKKTDTVLKEKAASLVSALNVQMKLNLDSYLSRMETIGTLAFAVEDAYTYDATVKAEDEYDALSTEKRISDKLYSLCIRENFVDYGIVYRNNHLVGKISNGTKSLFGDDLFLDLSGMITKQRTHDGWSAGFDGNFKRIYYVKQIHENAVLVISFYTSELQNVFDNPETLGDMAIRLTDSHYNILYSSLQEDELGEQLPEELVTRVEGQSAANLLDDRYLITVSGCGDNWYVICSIPTEIILKEKNEAALYIMITALVAAVLAILCGTFFSMRLANAAANLVSKLDSKAHIDQLTGIYNKKSFEELAQNMLADALAIERHALILLDVDNFKGVNDTLGHAYGDAVLAKIGSTLLQVFSAHDYLGRIGGDEFCVLMNIDPNETERYEDLVTEKCELLLRAFAGYYTGDSGDYKISCSMGVSFFPQHGKTFAELYAAADKALYHSKQSGKDAYTISGTEEEAVQP